ncbi:MAG: NAD(P)/FAD-dependent oxidoreductase [Terriglobia bacterium]
MRDVAVIGAGPAGLYAAYQLASAGMDVTVLDAQKKVGENTVCSGVVGEEAFVRFGLPSRPVLNRIGCIQAVSPAGRMLEYRSATPLARVVDKSEFNRDLANLARSAGAELCLGRHVNSIDREKDGVLLHFGSCQREVGRLKARVAVIASGVNGSLNGALGLVKPREFLRAIQADIPLGTDGIANPTEVYVGRSVAPGGFGWKIPLGHGRVRVGLMCLEDPRPYFSALLQRVAPGLDRSEAKVRQKAIGQMPVGNCVAERIVAIGEAAAHVKTSTGGGIYFGLLSAEMAADVLLRAFRKGDFSVQSLGEFERLWRAAFGLELWTGYLFRKLAARLSDHLMEKAFDRAKGIDLLSRLKGNLSFDWHHKTILASIRGLFAPAVSA